MEEITVCKIKILTNFKFFISYYLLPLKGSPPGPIIGIRIGGPRGPYLGPIGGNPGPIIGGPGVPGDGLGGDGRSGEF